MPDARAAHDRAGTGGSRFTDRFGLLLVPTFVTVVVRSLVDTAPGMQARGVPIGDVDADVAARTGPRLLRELEDPDIVGAGAHFPQVQFGRVAPGEQRRWQA